jgi:uncharacterized protein YjdB
MRSHPISLAAALLFLNAGAVVAQTVTELYVTPDTLRLEAGQRQGLTVQAFDVVGNIVLAVKFRVLDPGVAQVDGNGTVTAGRSGSTTVVVEAGKKTKAVAVYVAGGRAQTSEARRSGAQVPSDIRRLSAEPESLALLPSERGRVAVQAWSVDGTPAPGARLHWRSLRTAVAVVEDSTGIITGVSTGQATIQATAPGGPALDIPVTVSLAGLALDRYRIVLSPGESDTVRVLVPAQGDRQLSGNDLQWSMSDNTVAEVRPDGVVHALSPGRAELVVHGYLQELQIPVMVHQPVVRFAAAPRLTEPVRLPVQTSREFTLLPQTAESVPIEGVPVTWLVGDTSIATFDPTTGRLTAHRAGTTTLQFSTRGFLPAGWTIEVMPGDLAFARSRLALRPGERVELTPQFLDASGKPVLPATGLSWITSNAGVARVTPDGQVQAVAPGRAVITAQASGGQPAQATILVTGDLLVVSSRGGRFGVYALLEDQPENFFPVVADTLANYVDASYSPDRTRIAYSANQFGAGNYDIFVADADGQNAVRVTTHPAMDLQPVWSPDGQHLLFISLRSGVRQLYVMRSDGTEVRQLTNVPGGADQPAVSPDGKAVAFAGFPSGPEGQSDILVVPFSGGTPAQATQTSDRRETRPIYLSTGELAWVQVRREKREPDQLLRQAAPGGMPTPMISTDLTLVSVAASRDGSRLAWVASRPQERNRDVLEFTFQWRSLASGAETSVRLLPGERITSPAY